MILQFMINDTFVAIEETDGTIIEQLALDDDFTLDFLKVAIRRGSFEGFSPGDADGELHIERLFELGQDQEEPESEAEEEKMIWVRKKPTARDLVACGVMLDIRLKYDEQFTAKIIPRNILWHNIAKDLNALGYFVGNEIGGERCRQKFSNLQKKYLNYTNSEDDQCEIKKKPMFFNKLHSILGETVVKDEPEETKISVSRVSSPISLDDDLELSKEPQSSMLWMTKRPSELDWEATNALLDLRMKYAKYFDEGKTTKHRIWQVIAEKLNAKGYFVGAKRVGAERCRQKYSNLLKMYNTYKTKNQKTDIDVIRKKPLFYSKLQSILRNAPKAPDPEPVAEQSHPVAEKMELSENDCFEERLLNTVKNMHQETMQMVLESNQRVNKLVEEQNLLLSRQNKQREELIGVFKEIVNSLNSLKRKLGD